ncbi:biosynthetic-type acetolactate synthase large subunit [Stomatohabitans albus]|uniref:biosynthetic-type acetolactate synthase large subunit n=1 Tax=Stomatohabitans albus TaxID=3110766 RepID=UPI00300D1C9C
MTMTAAQVLMRSLEHAGVDVVFGHPGGAILAAYDSVYDSPIRHILARHEQCAGHMASGYAHATGRVGVAIATSGPGATNLVTALGDAMMDSVPMVAITGQVARASVGNDAFQEADMTGITHPVTKHNELVIDPERTAEAVAEAFHIAGTGRKGPVALDFPKDVLAATVPSFRWPKQLNLPGYKPTLSGHKGMVKQASKEIVRAKRPVLYVGGGAVAAGAQDEVMRLAETYQIPVVTTLMARGLMPESHSLCMGMPGMHGHWTAIQAIQESDLLIAIGTRFDDRVTGLVSAFAPHARVIHIDIDPAEIGKIRMAEVPIVGDAKVVLNQLLERMEKDKVVIQTKEWITTLHEWQREHPLINEQEPGGPLTPQTVLKVLDELRDEDSIITAGVGQHQMWAAQWLDWKRPRTWINSGGAGTMGYAVPAAIGAKAGCPDRQVIAIDGDGSFQMTSQELATATTEQLPICVVVLNNGVLGMVRQWQELFYNKRYSQTDLTRTSPDLVKLAEAYGGVGFRITNEEEVRDVLEQAFAIRDKLVIVDVWIDPDAKVFPMVPVGQSNSNVIESAAEWYASEAAKAATSSNIAPS